MIADDGQLLQQYTRQRSESAFGELVAKHIDLVYSAALRAVNGDAHLAQDVTQSVFIHLARRARNLPADIVLAGWLHRHTCYTAATAVRTEHRRRTREQTAMELAALDDASEPRWKEIAPYVDESLNQLRPSDRDALVLRFLKGQDFHAVGLALGVSEDAAQKRVSRALERLRTTLSRRGLVLSAATLASLLTAETVTAAPAGFAAAVTTASLTVTTGAGALSTALNLMAAKLNIGIIGTFTLVSLLVPLTVQHQARARLLDQAEALKRQANERIRLQAENQRMSNLLVGAQSTASADNQLNEVLKLRGEIGRLRASVDELATSQTNKALSREEVLASMRQMYQERINRLKQLFAANPGEAVPEFQYLTDSDWLDAIEFDRHRIDPDNRHAMSSLRSRAQIKFLMTMLSEALWQYGKSNEGLFPTDLSQLIPFFKSPVDNAVLQDWMISPTGSLPSRMRVDENWVITQKAPVNAELDQRVVVGMKGAHLGSGGTDDWVLAR